LEPARIRAEFIVEIGPFLKRLIFHAKGCFNLGSLSQLKDCELDLIDVFCQLTVNFGLANFLGLRAEVGEDVKLLEIGPVFICSLPLCIIVLLYICSFWVHGISD